MIISWYTPGLASWPSRGQTVRPESRQLSRPLHQTMHASEECRDGYTKRHVLYELALSSINSVAVANFSLLI
jgi:hypothetical protein